MLRDPKRGRARKAREESRHDLHSEVHVDLPGPFALHISHCACGERWRYDFRKRRAGEEISKSSAIDELIVLRCNRAQRLHSLLGDANDIGAKDFGQGLHQGIAVAKA